MKEERKGRYPKKELLDLFLPADADAVESGHVLAGVGEDVLDYAERLLGRVDVGVPHHIFFQNVVLYGACQLALRDALLFGGHDEEGQDRQNSAVHGHGHGDLKKQQQRTTEETEWIRGHGVVVKRGGWMDEPPYQGECQRTGFSCPRHC